MTDSTPLETVSDGLADLVAAASPRIAAIRAGTTHLSGFVWRPGLVVTADEALGEADEITVAFGGGQPRAARLLGRDPATDVALLQLDGETPEPLVFATVPARAGALALVVGAGPAASFGVVASVGPAWRSMRGGEIDARIELDARPRRAAEGGPVVDAAGQVLGMAVSGPRRRVLVIPGATIERVANLLARDGRVPRGYLGLGLLPVQVEGAAEPGAMVMNVDPTGPAAAAGFRQGDVILRWDGRTLPGIGALVRSLGSDSIGRAVAVELRRGGANLTLTLTVGERPRA